MTAFILMFAIMTHVGVIANMNTIIKFMSDDELFNKRHGLTPFPSVKILRSLRTALYLTLGLLVLAVGVYFLER